MYIHYIFRNLDEKIAVEYLKGPYQSTTDQPKIINATDAERTDLGPNYSMITDDTSKRLDTIVIIINISVNFV